MRNINFRILEMSSRNTARFVKVARNDYWKTICPSTYVNTTLNFSLFNYGSGLQNMSFYYGCNSASGLNLSSNSHVCNSSVTVSFLTQTQTSKFPDPVATGACQSMVPVPVFETAALALDSNQTTIQEAIDGGFELGLKIDNAPCNSCEASGGKCGLNTTNGDFICFCQDQPYAATTCSSSKSGMFDIYTLQVEDSILIKIARKAEDSYDFNCFGCRFKFTISRRDSTCLISFRN